LPTPQFCPGQHRGGMVPPSAAIGVEQQINTKIINRVIRVTVFLIYRCSLVSVLLTAGEDRVRAVRKRIVFRASE
jgi:hypothetical protein